MNSEALVGEALQEIVRADATLNRFVGMVRARSPVKSDLIKSEIAIAAGLKQTTQTKPVLDLLQESKLIQIDDDVIRIVGENPPPKEPNPSFVPPNEPMRAGPSASPNAPMGQVPYGIPLPLGPARLAYIQLPDDWQPRELGKLIKILQIALGEDADA